MPTTSRSIRLTVAFVVATLAAASTTAAVDAGRVPDDWGWAVVRSPGRSWYEITGKNRATSTGGKVIFKRAAKGYYRVRFKGIVTDTPHVQVSPLSSAGDMCSYYGLGFSGKPLEVYVSCRDRKGEPADVRFMVNFVEAHGFGAPAMAYAWAQSPKYPEYPAHPVYSYAWNGNDITVKRLGAGKYRVSLPGSGYIKGNIQITRFGSNKARICRVESWADGASRLDVIVRCRDQKGKAADAQFQLLFTADTGLKGNRGADWFYLYANKPKTKGYRPTSDYSSWSGFGRSWVKREGPGRYTVRLPTMPLGGAVQVTAVDGYKYCNASSVRLSGPPQRVSVRCFKANGTARADARCMLSYVK